MSAFKLSACLEGHDDDVRGIIFPAPDTVFSASRDATVRTWKRASSSPPKYESSIISQGSAFINAITFIPSSKDYPNGLVVSGGTDTVIEVRDPEKPHTDNAERLLMGHAQNVCALDVSPDGKWIVSGSWDGTARVWSVGKWECEAVLEGHQASVWDVLAINNETIITASADRTIGVFNTAGKLIQALKGGSDVVRALCRLPEGHESGADFASAGNDGLIKLWQRTGRQVGELRGHESFIYSIATLPNGDIASAGEDRTVRIWSRGSCIQTITHPAISVWTVAVCKENGDIVSGASDRIARIFTRSSDRQADAEALKAYDESIKSSSIPQQQVGEVNKEKLAGPEFLQQKSGTKEGQVVMIREDNGSVSAHSWSTAAQQWVNVGTVVDAAGSSGKKTEYLGQDYDYVFDVDIEDGKPPLKLPYNVSQNPYEAATKFIQDNELPMNYLDQVANFITTNTQGATIGQSSEASNAPSGADPWGMESRYRPGETAQPPAPQQPPARPKVLPQKEYLSIKAANLKAIQKKLEDLNRDLSAHSPDLALSAEELTTIQTLTRALESTPGPTSPSPALDAGLTLITQLLTRWPPAERLPLLDLLRLLTAATPAAGARPSNGATLLDVLDRSGVLADPDRPNNVMLAVRALANLFATDKGRELMDVSFDQVQKLIVPLAKGGGGGGGGSGASASGASLAGARNLTIAVATLLINYAVLLTAPSHRDLPSSLDRGLALLEPVSALLGREKDAEAVYRGLVALGTLLALGEDAQQAAQEVYGVEALLGRAEEGAKEPRIKAVVREIRELLE